MKIRLSRVVAGLLILFVHASGLPNGAEGMNFPDVQSYKGVAGVQVAVISYENMNDISLTAADIIKHVKNSLEKSGVSLHHGSQLVAANASPREAQKGNQSHDALLGIRMRRTEDSALFGASKIGVVTLTMSLFQPVTVKENQHVTHAITWNDSRSISGASRRPRKILEALDELLAAFVKDFAPAASK
ncbi:MAG: hypothetical protein MRJ96_14825 [Nitrospirales bacterium]|nr:hypothetical protein [Nitrospira sp.]MDR4502716.1 hypothetical protein [Nitrospirales bacterium]